MRTPQSCCGESAGAMVRGSEEDVLSRYLGAARRRARYRSEITADCPLIDPQVTDAVVTELKFTRCLRLPSICCREHFRGLDSEALFRDTLERIIGWRRLDRSASTSPSFAA